MKMISLTGFFFELLNLVLVQDPKIRVTASEALDHTYFRDLDK